MSPEPKHLVPQAKAAPTLRDIRASISWLRHEANNRNDPFLAEVADEMEWLAREVLASQPMSDYGRPASCR